MGKSILMSIQPKYVAKILNGEKTIEIRKLFPKDYVGWVYIYCTKAKPNLWLPYEFDFFPLDDASQPYLSDEPIIDLDTKLNGKVVAKFWCDKVEEITPQLWTPTKEQEILKGACLTENELFNYIGDNSKKPFYAIHITKLEVFDKPRRINDFIKYDKNTLHIDNCIIGFGFGSCERLANAPQSWCYIEGEND